MKIFLIFSVYILFVLIFLLIGNNFNLRKEKGDLLLALDEYEKAIKTLKKEISHLKKNELTDEEKEKIKKEKRHIDNFFSYDGTKQE